MKPSEPGQLSGNDTHGAKANRLPMLFGIVLLIILIWAGLLTLAGQKPRDTVPDNLLNEQQAKALADTFFAKEMYGKALEHYQIASSHAPQNSEYQRRIGRAHTHLNQFELARTALDNALAIDQQEYPATLNIANDWLYIGRMHREMSQYDKAHQAISKALQVSRELQLPLEKQLPFHTELAVNHIWRGQYPMANTILEETFKRVERQLTADHPATSSLYAARGLLNNRLKNFDQAAKDLEMALHLDIAKSGKHSTEVARQRNNLGVLYEGTNQLAKALTQFKTSLSVLENIYGLNHATIVATLNNIAHVYMKQGKFKEAELQLQKAIQINADLETPRSRMLMFTLLNLGEVNVERERYTKALNYYQQGESLARELFGNEHPSTALCWSLLGKAHTRLGNTNKAREYLQMALPVFERVNGAEHSQTRQVQQQLAALPRQ